MPIESSTSRSVSSNKTGTAFRKGQWAIPAWKA
jgi:hypothetical protein